MSSPSKEKQREKWDCLQTIFRALRGPHLNFLVQMERARWRSGWVSESKAKRGEKKIELTKKGSKDNRSLHTHLLSVVQLGFRSPCQKRNNVLGHLRSCRRSTILVLDETIVKHSSHSNSSSREVRVVVETFTDLDTCRRVDVSSDQGVNVILDMYKRDEYIFRIMEERLETTHGTTVTSLDHEGKIRRKSTSVSSSSSFFVGVRCGHVIGKFTRTLEHGSLGIGTILVFDFFGHRLDFIDSVGNTDQVAPGDSVERVTSGANFSVNLVSTSNSKSGHEHNEFLIPRCSVPRRAQMSVVELTKHDRKIRKVPCEPKGTQEGEDRDPLGILPLPRARKGCHTAKSTMREFQLKRRSIQQPYGLRWRHGRKPTVSAIA